MDNRFNIQEQQYSEPYHHYVSINPFSLYKSLNWGLEYYSYIKSAIDVLESNKNSVNSVADVGCGDGKLLLEISERFPEIDKVHGYDLSERSILFARAYTYGRNVECFVRDLRESKETYEMLFCMETLEHISDSDTPGFIASLSEHLKAGGQLVVSVPSKNRPQQDKHYRHYTAESLTDALEGFQCVKVHYLDEPSMVKALLSNPLFILRLKPLRSLLVRIYDRFSLHSSPLKGTHVFGVYKKI